MAKPTHPDFPGFSDALDRATGRDKDPNWKPMVKAQRAPAKTQKQQIIQAARETAAEDMKEHQRPYWGEDE